MEKEGYMEECIDEIEEWRYQCRLQRCIQSSREISSSFRIPSCSTVSPFARNPYEEFLLRLQQVNPDEYGHTTSTDIVMSDDMKDSTDSNKDEEDALIQDYSIAKQIRYENDIILQEIEKVISSASFHKAGKRNSPLRKIHDKYTPIYNFGTSRLVEARKSEIEELEERLRNYRIARESTSIEESVENRIAEVHYQDILGTIAKEELPILIDQAIEELQKALKGRTLLLSEEEEEIVQMALYQGDDDEVLVQKFNTDITRKHISCLEPATWLNDEVINFWFNLMQERDNTLHEQNPSTWTKNHFFNTFFYTKLSENNGYHFMNVRRWTRKFDIFALDKIFIPVNISNTHWCLAVIYMKNKYIQYYDSMMGSGMECIKCLLHYLEDEMLDKKKQDFDASEWRLVPTQKGTPQQNNGSDCGVFTCIFADYVSMKEDLDFSCKNMPYFRKMIIHRIVTGSL